MIAQMYKPPTVTGSIADINIDIFTTSYTIMLAQLFTDPQGLDLSYALSLQASNSLPATITAFNLGLITFSFTTSDAGTILLKVTATNSAGVSSFINFRVIVKGCYNGCATCTSTAANACTACNDGYFLKGSQCLASCPVGTWTDNTNKLCNDCPSQCTACSGSSADTQCSACATGYYLFNSGCQDRCPTNYWEKDSTKTCELIDAENTHNYASCLALVAAVGGFESRSGQSVLTNTRVIPFT